MASSDQSLDELIMCLVSMGFDLDDCHEAVKIGKLSVEAAIEWILAGKPALPSSGTLRLNTPLQSTLDNPPPLMQSQPPTAAASAAAACAPLASSEDKEEDVKVVSRSHLSDEQRGVIDRFEEKQREEAKRVVKEERLAKKRAHEAALKQIQEDRERFKVKNKSNPSDPQTSSKASSAPSPQKSSSSMLQIRLPNGQALKKSFPVTDTLSSVWKFVGESFPIASSMQLMQPFPRQEFNETHMQKSLKELNLFPTGSLVLKKIERVEEPAASNVENSPMNEEPEVVSNVDEVAALPAHLGVMHHQPSINHNWGSGVQLDAADSNNDNQEEEAVAMEAEEVVEDQDAVEMGPVPLPAVDPFLQEHQWGDGERLSGDIRPQWYNHQASDPRDLAAAKARERVSIQPRIIPCQEPVTHTIQTLPSFRSTLLHYVVRRLCDQTQSPLNLVGISSDVAELLLKELIKERLLRPKTLHLFLPCHLPTLILDCYPYATNELMHEISFHSCLGHLSLRDCCLITDKGLTEVKALKRLKVLNLRGCSKLTDKCVQGITGLSNLQVLVLEGTSVTDCGVALLCAHQLPHLHSLDLCKTQITQQSFKSLKSLPKLTHLNLKQTKVTSLDDIELLIHLRSLNLANTRIGTNHLHSLLSLPLKALNISDTANINGDSALNTIASLHLHQLSLPNRLTTSDVGISSIANMPLLSLDLTNYINVTDDGFESIGKITSLKRLLLSNTRISDTGMLFLEGLTDLEEMSLDRTVVGDQGASVIRRFTKLHQLSLSETSVTDQFLQTRTLDMCYQLSRLNLSRTHITDEGAQCLHHPTLSCLNLDGTAVHPEIADVIKNNCPKIQAISTKNLSPAPIED